MIDKGKLFRKAWRMAKRAAAETGEKAVKFFSESLKIVWKDVNYPRPKGHGLVTAQS